MLSKARSLKGISFSSAQVVIGCVVMTPPICQMCRGTECSELETLELREKWACEAKLKWSWHSDTLAYWHLCMPCHQSVRPSDFRTNNRYSLPGHMAHSKYSGNRRGVVRLVSGDFHLTDPSPEIFRLGDSPPEPWPKRFRSNSSLLPMRYASYTLSPITPMSAPLTPVSPMQSASAPLSLVSLRSCLKGARGYRLRTCF